MIKETQLSSEATHVCQVPNSFSHVCIRNRTMTVALTALLNPCGVQTPMNKDTKVKERQKRTKELYNAGESTRDHLELFSCK